MDAKKLSESWQEQSQEMSTRIARWRVEHPTATLAEIEQAVDEQISGLRAQIIQIAAQVSTATEGRTPTEANRLSTLWRQDAGSRSPQAPPADPRGTRSDPGSTVSQLSALREQLFFPSIKNWTCQRPGFFPMRIAAWSDGQVGCLLSKPKQSLPRNVVSI